ncbi:MAG: FeoB-associated Cys-rich membrane protein [Lachnospiraceae bacterium]
MINIIIVIILILLIAAAIFHLWKEKKKGRKCMGCTMAGCCSKNSRDEK